MKVTEILPLGDGLILRALTSLFRAPEKIEKGFLPEDYPLLLIHPFFRSGRRLTAECRFCASENCFLYNFADHPIISSDRCRVHRIF